jgi:DNA gyrase/topoisomerase IV subunit B
MDNASHAAAVACFAWLTTSCNFTIVLTCAALQDHDGSHIKGLIMNFLHTFYPSLLKVPGFLVEFITPIIKVRMRLVC